MKEMERTIIFSPFDNIIVGQHILLKGPIMVKLDQKACPPKIPFLKWQFSTKTQKNKWESFLFLILKTFMPPLSLW